MAADTTAGVPHRGWITASIMVASMMYSIDTTVVNVSLPYMQGSLSATSNQISWALTCYIVATAVGTPLSGWLAGRLGLRRTILIATVGFTLASLLCGVAASLAQIVLFRILQGLFGAVMVPLSQTVLFNINPPEKHARAMGLWSTGTVLGPILGPILGGWLTEVFSWRWCFLINLPLGALSILGVLLFMPKEDDARRRRFDFLGYSALALGVGALQLMLDRGPEDDWFNSAEIWTYAVVALGAAWVFVVHTVTAQNAFIDRALLRDRNLVTATLLGFVAGTMMLSTFSILPIVTQTLLGNPPITAGFLNLPRAFGMTVAVVITGRLSNLVDNRFLLLAALLSGALALKLMSDFDLMMDSRLILLSGLVQGFSTGMLFVPTTTLAFATIGLDLRAEASALFNLPRSLGGSVGISVMQALAFANTAKMHEALAGHVVPNSAALRAGLSPVFDPATVEGALRLNAEITRQAMMVAYLNDFRFMMWLCLLSAPLLLLMRPTRKAPVAVAGGAAP